MAPTSNTPDPADGGDTAEATDSPQSADSSESADPAAAPSLLEQMGGVSGLIYSTVPVVVFVPANMLFGLTGAIITAVTCAAVIFVIRLLRREPATPALAGLFGVAICAYIAHRTGSAKGYFLFGIWTTLLYAGALLLSIAVRWPLIGVAWNAVNGSGQQWRRNRRMLIAYDIATALWALVFAARYLVQSSLYDSSHTGWLAAARIGMGWPLTAVAVAGTVYLVRRAERSAQAPDAGAEVAR